MKSIKQDINKSFIKQNGAEFSFFLDKDFIAFKGHFPRYPLLPGIVQIDMVLFCIRKLLNRDTAEIKEIRKVKFAKPILPKSQVDISITANDLKFNALVKCENIMRSQISLEII
jgi:3-hydroxymyristoyl/3-hydroxydecanoyl-(acyl carrier protein) dehydratase